MTLHKALMKFRLIEIIIKLVYLNRNMASLESMICLKEKQVHQDLMDPKIKVKTKIKAMNKI
jgi:hypothetical protein